MTSAGAQTSEAHPHGRARHPRRAARDPHEPHRVATPLELLFDLCFVVAIAELAERLHHGVAEGHTAAGLLGYAMVFFAVWWAWMNFTWFASAFDADDTTHRLLVLLQIAGVLVLAAGIPRAFDELDFTVVTVGYAIIRSAMVALWLRAARFEHAPRKTALRFAAGIATCQLAWIGLLSLPAPLRLYGFPVLVAAELAVPLWAEHERATPWHPHHIAERYGLFTLIVLGESVLAAVQATQAAIASSAATGSLLALSLGGLVILFSMWWIYFEHPAQDTLVSSRAAFAWGYGHFVVFASIAAVGVGIAITADHAAGHTHLSRAATGYALAVPVATYVCSVWLVQVRKSGDRRARGWHTAVVALLILLAPLLPKGGVLAIGALVAALAFVQTRAPHTHG